SPETGEENRADKGMEEHRGPCIGVVSDINSGDDHSQNAKSGGVNLPSSSAIASEKHGMDTMNKNNLSKSDTAGSLSQVGNSEISDRTKSSQASPQTEQVKEADKEMD
ncbi:hypothetical protein PMAYCL1PPCAC_28836, partial [Pristionchus mayeri]